MKECKSVTAAFWIIYAVWSLVPIWLGSHVVGSTSPTGIFIQAVCCLWILAPVACLFHRVAGHAVALLAVSLAWLPMWIQTLRRLYYMFFYGMEEPDGTGSPLLFLYNFMREQVFAFIPLTVMLVLGFLALSAQIKLARRDTLPSKAVG